MNSYLDQARKLRARFPCMKQFFADWERLSPNSLPRTLSLNPVSSRCGVLEFIQNEQPRFIDLSDQTDLQNYINTMNTNYSCQNRLFLLEDLEESKLETLGSALMIDPLVLADHLFTYHFSQTHTIPHRKLPSVINAERSFTLRYYELRETGHRVADAQTSRRRTFARASRQIESWKDLAEYQKETIVDLVRHNISFWCDKGLGRDKNQGAWNGMSIPAWLKISR
ncbi:hypothetical protein N7528_007240 [Penicillium herquei]|nr:hypothetical protein N7528_007240 [Penicillium herquei]